jgi:hypothetical protein
VPVATDGFQSTPPRGTVLSIAALPDGRAALAYATAANGINVGFFDGTAWSAFRAVPGATFGAAQFGPVSVARGVDGAVLELAFLDTDLHVRHTRLTDEASWTWSAPVMVGDASSHTRVWIATGP